MKEQLRRQLQKSGLDILAQSKKGFQFTNTFFPYTSGEIGPYYVQAGAVMEKPEWYQAAVRDTETLIAEEVISIPSIDVISGGESRDWMFSLPMALNWNKAHVMIYKKGKIVGADMKGKRILHVADLNNEGSSPRDSWIPAIKKAGGTPEHYICYIDRMEDGVKVIEQELGLPRSAVVELDSHAWDYLKQIKVVTPEQYKNLRDRGTTKEQKDTWARTMLRSDAGFRTLVTLIQDDKTLGKAKKIINTGYPDIRDELMGRIKKSDTDAFTRLVINGNGGIM